MATMEIQYREKELEEYLVNGGLGYYFDNQGFYLKIIRNQFRTGLGIIDIFGFIARQDILAETPNDAAWFPCVFELKSNNIIDKDVNQLMRYMVAISDLYNPEDYYYKIGQVKGYLVGPGMEPSAQTLFRFIDTIEFLQVETIPDLNNYWFSRINDEDFKNEKSNFNALIEEHILVEEEVKDGSIS